MTLVQGGMHLAQLFLKERRVPAHPQPWAHYLPPGWGEGPYRAGRVTFPHCAWRRGSIFLPPTTLLHSSKQAASLDIAEIMLAFIALRQQQQQKTHTLTNRKAVSLLFIFSYGPHIQCAAPAPLGSITTEGSSRHGEDSHPPLSLLPHPDTCTPLAAKSVKPALLLPWKSWEFKTLKIIKLGGKNACIFIRSLYELPKSYTNTENKQPSRTKQKYILLKLSLKANLYHGIHLLMWKLQKRSVRK